MTRHDTIAAIATAPGPAGVAVVRVSGPEALAVGACVAGRTLTPGLHFVRTPIDECVVLVFTRPKSYTGEDVVEFQCHGGDVTPRRLLEACFAAGARLARRGEFTERAFLNGKIDALQAESVLDLINAKTVRAAEVAREGLSGRRQHAYRALYDRALALSTQLEHALDVAEGELPERFFASVRSQQEDLSAAVAAALSSAREGRILREGACVVLSGPPNAGKSSLLNALLGEDRAIVSDVPGTTRDTIEAWIDLDGYPVRLVDTAGLRATDDAIEAEGVRRSQEQMARADVVIAFTDSRDGAEMVGPEGTTTIFIHAKCDLSRGEGLNVSAKTGEGLSALRRRIVEALNARKADEGALGTQPSQQALSVLLDVERQLSRCPLAGAETDLVLTANVVRTVADTLGGWVGAVYASDLMEQLFSRFCVGK